MLYINLKTKIMNIALLETWTESERGWGSRNDGCTLHLTKEDYKKYVEEYWKTMPDKVPDEYSRPDGNLKAVVISDDLLKSLNESKKFGICLWQSEFREKKNSKEIMYMEDAL